MSSDSTQLKLGQKKKVPKPKITERTAIDHNTWVLPDDVDLIKESIEICELHSSQDVNTFYLCQNKMQWDFAFDDGTLLFTNHPCPGCGKKHNASIDLETAETTQQCLKTNAIFKNVNGKKAVQVQMICPECNKMHITVDYPTWKTLSDKNCAECQQEATAEKEDKRKKSKKLSKEAESTAQPTPETTIEEVAEAIEELVPEEPYCNHCKKAVDTVRVNDIEYCSECDLDISGSEEKEDYGELISVTCPHCGHQDEMEENSPSSGLLCDNCDKTIPNPNLEKFPLKQDNGTREGLPENFNKKEITPRGVKSDQINLDQFCTMLINTNKLQTTDFQFREQLDKGHIALLAESIKSFGKNIESIIVRQTEDGNYEIVSGHHRVAAAKKAKVKFVKCDVIDADDKESLEISITTNFTQKDMNPLEESRAIQKYQELSPELTQEEIANKFGKSQQWISSRLSLLEAPEFAQQKLAEGKITASHLETVSSLPPEDQESIITDSARQCLSVRDTERLVKEKKKEYKAQEKLVKAYEDLELYLTDHLDELKGKRISRSSIHDTTKRADYYDIYFGDLLKELNLSENYSGPLYSWNWTDEITIKIDQILKKVGLELINAFEQFNEDRVTNKTPEEAGSVCKYCRVEKRILGKHYCPFGLSEEKQECAFQDNKEEAAKYCFLCGKEFVEEDFLRKIGDGKNTHMSCYLSLMESTLKSVTWTKCKDKCKRSGSCTLQDEIYEDAEEYDHAIKLELQDCAYWKDIDAPDNFYLHYWGTNYYELYDEYGTETKVGENLADVVQFIREKGIDASIIIAKTPEDQADLDKMFELLKLPDSSKEEESS